MWACAASDQSDFYIFEIVLMRRFERCFGDLEISDGEDISGRGFFRVRFVLG